MRKNVILGLYLLPHAKRLDKASSIFFFLGFFLSNLGHLYIPYVSISAKLLATGCTLIGNLLWLISTFLYPNQQERHRKWYNSLQYKYQFLISSILGILAAALGIGAVFFPPLIVPVLWIFAISNIIWLVGEFHKLKNPPLYDKEYSHTRQKVYVQYSVTMTAVSLIAASAATLALVFPPAAVFILAGATVLGVCLSLFAFHFWLNFTWGKHEPLQAKGNSHEMMNSNKLGANLRNTSSPSADKQENFTKLFEKNKESSLDTTQCNPENYEGSEFHY